MTLNDSQRAYLRAAIACLLTVQGEAARRGAASFDSSAGFCADLRDEVLAIATKDGAVPPLDHQDGAELADLLDVCSLELRMPDHHQSGAKPDGTIPFYDDQGACMGFLHAAAAKPDGTFPFYDDAPGSYTDQVGADEEVFKVPCMLTVTGAETEDAAAVLADTFLGRAVMDATVNADEVVMAFEVGYEEVFVPAAVPAAVSAGEAVRQV